MECCERNCGEQYCKADICVLKCNGGECKRQKCEDEVKECKMHLGCSGVGNCEQTARPKHVIWNVKEAGVKDRNAIAE